MSIADDQSGGEQLICNQALRVCDGASTDHGQPRYRQMPMAHSRVLKISHNIGAVDDVSMVVNMGDPDAQRSSPVDSGGGPQLASPSSTGSPK
jgi:hypothetical protein